uniref:Uncharacterized protein n=1 Tax=Rhizophora mucronata TaxID=61149 RepID=A0A2P2P4N8_RHIMU
MCQGLVFLTFTRPGEGDMIYGHDILLCYKVCESYLKPTKIIHPSLTQGILHEPGQSLTLGILLEMDEERHWLKNFVNHKCRTFTVFPEPTVVFPKTFLDIMNLVNCL